MFGTNMFTSGNVWETRCGEFSSRSNTLFTEPYRHLCITVVVGTNHSRFTRAFFPSGIVTCEPRISSVNLGVCPFELTWHVPSENRPACGGSEDFSTLPHVRQVPNLNQTCAQPQTNFAVGHLAVLDEHDWPTGRRIRFWWKRNDVLSYHVRRSLSLTFLCATRPAPWRSVAALLDDRSAPYAFPLQIVLAAVVKYFGHGWSANPKTDARHTYEIMC